MEDLAQGDFDDGDVLEKILALSREKLVEAVQDTERLQTRVTKESEIDKKVESKGDVSSDEKDLLERLPTKEREKALKRLRNKEAARRSRQRKQARMRELSESVDSLQRENIMLMACIEHFSDKALEARKHAEQMGSAAGKKSLDDDVPPLDNLGDLNTGGGPLTGRGEVAALDEQLAMLSSRDISPRDDETNIDDRLGTTKTR